VGEALNDAPGRAADVSALASSALRWRVCSVLSAGALLPRILVDHDGTAGVFSLLALTDRTLKQMYSAVTISRDI
jgi:hypothetical protein